MGILGLYTYIKFYCPETLEWTQIKNCTAVIDGCNLAYFLYTYTDKTTPCVFGGEYQNFAIKVKHFFKSLIACNIKPIVVMDGGHALHQRKMLTVLTRIRDLTRLTVRVTPEDESTGMNQTYPLLLRRMLVDAANSLNITCLQCDFEADDDIVVIAQKLNAYVISNDTDFFLSDVKFVLLKSLNIDAIDTKSKKSKGIPCHRFDRDLFCELTKISLKKLPLLAICLGNDHHESSVMKQFYTILPSYKSCSGNARHKLIGCVILWLGRQSQDTSRVLQKMFKPIKNLDANMKAGIRACIKSYKPVSSYLTTLVTPHKEDCPARHVDQPFASNKIDFGTHRVLPGNWSTNKCTCKPPAESNIFHNESLPQWFVEAYRYFDISNVIPEMLHQNRFYCCPVIESSDLTSIHLPSKKIIKAVRAILWKSLLQSKDIIKPTDPNLEKTLDGVPTLRSITSCDEKLKVERLLEYYSLSNEQANELQLDDDNDIDQESVAGDILFRTKSGKVLPDIRWYYRKNTGIRYTWFSAERLTDYKYLPSLYAVEGMSVEQRKRLFFKVLGYRIDLPALPSVLESVLVSICHWAKENKFDAKTQYTSSLIMNLLMFCIIEGRHGDIQYYEGGENPDKYWQQAISRGDSLEPITAETLQQMSIAQIIESLTRAECQVASVYLSCFHTRRHVKTRNFDRDLVHAANAFQASTFYLSILNSVLYFPFRVLSIDKYWNGVFNYNVTHCFLAVDNPMAAIRAILPRSEKIVHLFMRFFDILNDQLNFCSLKASEVVLSKTKIATARKAILEQKPTEFRKIKMPHTVKVDEIDRETQRERIENPTEEELAALAENKFGALLLY